MLEAILIWTLLGAYAVGIETGSLSGNLREAPESGGRAMTVRLLLYGPTGWLILAAVHILPRFVDSKIQT